MPYARPQPSTCDTRTRKKFQQSRGDNVWGDDVHPPAHHMQNTTLQPQQIGTKRSPVWCRLIKHTFGDDKLSTRDDLTAHLHRYDSQEVSQEE